MKNTKNKKGFTLVELIIVITILAILATIAFISFQSYTAQSRDAKVQSELGGARNAIEAELAKNSSILLSLATENDTNSRITTLDLGGKTNVDTTSNYKAGDLNTTLLGGVKFDNKYKVGVTNVIGDNYQLAGTLTDGGSKAYVIGNYNPRKDTDTASGTVNGTTLTLTSGLGVFKVGDILESTNGTGTGKITAISSDLTKITLDTGSAVTTGNAIKLAEPESGGLISNGGTNIVTNNGTVLPY